MKKLTTTFLASTLLVSGLAIADPVYARSPGGPGFCHRDWHAMAPAFGPGAGERIERLAERLDLTSEQRSAVRAIVDEARPQMRELRDKLRANRKELYALAQEDTPSEDDVRKLAEAQGVYKADLIVLRTKVHSKIRKVLSEEQRDQLETMRRAPWARP